jgi:DNA invertase Pin-like site-specific DNA recombinase
MTVHEPLPPAVLERKAVVYVRQSTVQQVQTNLESQRRQYELVEVARRRGFKAIEVIDDDLGRSASGAVERPGFDRLVAALCAGQIGAVLCLDASRLARNGRDWHHLLELCGLVDARVIDPDGVYDPCRPNDRLLLGMKGSISEFELGILRSRMLEAARSKARRGELRISIPIGYAWDRHVGLDLDPDRRLQEVIRLVFQKFRELGSARQVLLWMVSQGIHFPYPSDGRTWTLFEWRPIRYPQKPVLCRRLRIREEREAHDDRRRPSAQELRPWQTDGGVGDPHQGSSRGLHQLDGVRAQSGAAGRQCVRQSR